MLSFVPANFLSHDELRALGRCRHCKALITGKRHGASFCSSKCRQADYRVRQKVKEQCPELYATMKNVTDGSAIAATSVTRKDVRP